jgi:DHA1 family multidrug resistance protein-like MFS transporter
LHSAPPDLEKGQDNDSPTTTGEQQYLVEFEGPNDPGNPKSWAPKRRWAITVSMGLMVFTVTFASSIFSVNVGYVRERFDVTLVTATLGVALFVLVRRFRKIVHFDTNMAYSRVSSLALLHLVPCQKF